MELLDLNVSVSLNSDKYGQLKNLRF